MRFQHRPLPLDPPGRGDPVDRWARSSRLAGSSEKSSRPRSSRVDCSASMSRSSSSRTGSSGLAAISLYPIQAWLIPQAAEADRQVLTRSAPPTRAPLADKIGEAVTVIGDIHTNDTARWHLAQARRRPLLEHEDPARAFQAQVHDQVHQQLHEPPDAVLSSIPQGGYLVIKGDLDFGSLVAVLAAYKDVAALHGRRC